MTANGWLQIALFCAIVVALTRPFGGYMTRVFAGERRSCVRSSAASSRQQCWSRPSASASSRRSSPVWSASSPDLVILDLGLPDMDGIDVIRAVRARSALPIIVLSVREDERGKVEALDLGADDYVTKPFGADELVARIRTALRHRFQELGEKPIFISGDLSVDLVRRIVKRGGAELHLSPKEYELLAELVANAGKVLTHRHILAKVWGPAHVEDAPYLRVFIRSLRHKLELDPARPTHITTEPGVGYRLRRPEDETRR